MQSCATNLVPQRDANGNNHDIFVRALQTGTTTLLSPNKDGSSTGDAESVLPIINASGDWTEKVRRMVFDFIYSTEYRGRFGKPWLSRRGNLPEGKG